MIDTSFDNSSSAKIGQEALLLVDNSPSKLPGLNTTFTDCSLPIEMSLDHKPVLQIPSAISVLKKEQDPLKTLIEDHIPRKLTAASNKDTPIFERLKLKHLDAHLRNEFVPDNFSQKDIPKEFSKYTIEVYTSLHDLIHDSVLPQWVHYLTQKRERTASICGKKRADTFKKKILRDLREFYRILFRKRFSSKEFKSKQGMVSCVQKIFSEMQCFDASEDDLQDYHLFRYFHQTHYCTLNKVLDGDERTSESYFAVEKYNDRKFVSFLKHPLTAQMFYFVYTNFMEVYSPEIKPEYRDRVTKMITNILSFYQNCGEVGDLDRMTSDLFLS
ncbi:unnamed protein product [Moneuplotes crassus]|uniref:Uncharacterized protein n=1 Tax=Euplotes crassus TaxID=5936 RepID=A0AAD1U2C3_EUPCR|nr:unnamed protein product [Moneuplotes crassus]